MSVFWTASLVVITALSPAGRASVARRSVSLWWQRWSRTGTPRVPPRTASQLAMAAAALPFEPQPLPHSTAGWFEGWFVRLVDHPGNASVALVLGSLRKRRRGRGTKSKEAERRRQAVVSSDGGVAEWQPPFDEHIMVLAYSDASGHHTHTLELAGSAVALSGGRTSPSRAAGPRVRWWSERHGGLLVEGDSAVIDVSPPGAPRLIANVSGPRVVWSGTAPDRAGPEGWLAQTGMLPCHYFVHSFGSPSSYRLVRRGERQGGGHGRRVALAHMERNYGEAFPQGYTWAQATAAGGAAFLVVTGGLFVVGPLTTLTYIIALRMPATALRDALEWNFRSTDLDRIVPHRDPCRGILHLNATSLDGRRSLRLRLSAPPRSFGARMPIPTTAGFSRMPGCRESYDALAELEASERVVAGRWRQRLTLRMPLAALEFGGSWQCAQG